MWKCERFEKKVAILEKQTLFNKTEMRTLEIKKNKPNTHVVTSVGVLWKWGRMLWSNTINSALDSAECGWVIRTSEQVLNVAALPVQTHSNPLLEFPNHMSLELNIVSQLIHMMDDWVPIQLLVIQCRPDPSNNPREKSHKGSGLGNVATTGSQSWGWWPCHKRIPPLSGVSRNVGSGSILHEPQVPKLESPSPQGSIELLQGDQITPRVHRFCFAMCAFLNIRTFRINWSNLRISSVHTFCWELFDFPELPIFSNRSHFHIFKIWW